MNLGALAIKFCTPVSFRQKKFMIIMSIRNIAKKLHVSKLVAKFLSKDLD
jgi:hypothetical protein